MVYDDCVYYHRSQEIHFTITPAYVLAVLNTATVISCGPPISVPPTDVEWNKNFQQLSGNCFQSNLTILDTQLSDNGVYYCTASNPLTTQSVVSRGANVSVKGIYCILLFVFKMCNVCVYYQLLHALQWSQPIEQQR